MILEEAEPLLTYTNAPCAIAYDIIQGKLRVKVTYEDGNWCALYYHTKERAVEHGKKILEIAEMME